MTIKTKLMTLVLSCFSTFWAFAQNPIDYVPDDATFVMSMNPNHLNQKVGLEQLTKLSFFQDMLGSMANGGNPDAVDDMKAALQSPAKYGFDFMTNSYMVAQVGDEGSFFSYIFKITDSSKAHSFLKNQAYEGVDYFGDATGNKLMQGDGFDYLAMADGSKVVWTDNIGMMVSGSVEFEFEEYSEEEFALSDSLNNAAINDYMLQVLEKPSNCIKNNTRFTSNNNNSDMHFWMDYSFLQKMNAEQLPEEFSQYGVDMLYESLMSFYDDTYISMNLNFDKGAMNVDTKMYMNPEVASMWASSMDTKMNKKLHKYIKGNNLMGYFTMNYNLRNAMEASKTMIYQSLQDIPMMGDMATSAMDIIGIAIDEEALYDLWKGDMVFAVTGMREFEKEIVTYEYDEDFNQNEVKRMSKETLPEFTMMMSYGNRNDLMKFVRLAEKFGSIQSKGNYFQINSSELPMDMYLAMQDGILFFTNDSDLVSGRLGAGFPKSQRLSKKHCKTMKDHVSTFYWDIPQTLDVVSELGLPMGFSGNQMMTQSKETFESMLFTADKTIENGVSKGKMQFNFTNKQQNSLEQFFNYINDIYISEMGGRSM